MRLISKMAKTTKTVFPHWLQLPLHFQGRQFAGSPGYDGKGKEIEINGSFVLILMFMYKDYPKDTY